MAIIIPFLCTLCSAGTAVVLSKRKFDEVLPLVMMGSALLIYLSGFLEDLRIGYWLCAAFAGAFPILLLVGKMRKRKWAMRPSDFFTPGLVIFCALFVFLFVLNIKRQFTVWDEFMHWGPMVKEMFRLDRFYSVAESVIPMHKDYPPVISILQLFWCKMAGEYREGYLYISLQLLTFSMFLPALSSLKFRKKFSFYVKLAFMLAFMITSALLITLSEAKFYTTIYIDCFLAVILAYGLYISVGEGAHTAFNIVRLAVCLAFLLLSKQMGLVFFLLIVGAYFLNYAALHYGEIKTELREGRLKRRLWRMGLAALCVTVVPYLFLTAWNFYIREIPRQFNISSIDFASFPGILQGRAGAEWQQISARNYLKFVIKSPLVDFPLNFTYWQLILIGSAILYLAGRYRRANRRSLFVLNTVFAAGAVGYAFVMLLLYTYAFGSYEGPILACVDRYLDTYIFVGFILASFLFLDGVSRLESIRRSLAHLCGLLILLWTVWLPAWNIIQLVPSVIYSPARDSLPSDTREVVEKTPQDAKIFMISQGDRFYCTYYVANYVMMPRICNPTHYSLGAPYGETDIRTQDISLSVWKEMLSGWDYLFLHYIDGQFIEKYGATFEEGTILQNGQIYRIVKENGEFSALQPVE